MTPWQESLRRLEEGNRRYVAGTQQAAALPMDELRKELEAGQHPFAVVVGCSDSRVLPNFIFDQGLGDLFVVRVAGHVVAPSQLGSVEFAVEHLGSNLVVVLGHEKCGAVKATLQGLIEGTLPADCDDRSLVGIIRPAIEKLLSTDLRDDPEALLAAAIRANVDTSVERLLASPLLAARVESGDLAIIGAEYELGTGVVRYHEKAE